ncbi:MAG: hypothetical protein DRG83_00140 [Deltaproteobacteria bacterium]|nr:MAG: hypothetical protein DRG83_00140 [Deltaproteobacteria bacterium]
MGGGKKKTKTVQRVYYPPGFESFFRRAGDILLKHAQVPRGPTFEMKLSPFEKDIYGRVSSLLSAGTTPVDTLVQNYFLNRMGITSPLSRLTGTSVSESPLQVLPSLSESGLPEYYEPIPPAISLPQSKDKEEEWSLPTSWQQLFTVAPLPKSPSDVLRSLQIGATALALKQQFPELTTNEAQGIISDLLSRSYSYDYGYGLPDSVGRFLYGKDEPIRRAFRMLESAGLLNIRDVHPEV